MSEWASEEKIEHSRTKVERMEIVDLHKRTDDGY